MIGMVHVSKKRLKKEVADKVHKQFLHTVTNLRGTEGSRTLEELFTQTEQVMFAKRLAAIFMLTQGAPPFHASKVLRLSSSTVSRLQIELENGKYTHIESLVQKKKDRDRMWADLEVLIRFGMPEMGKNRWKWLNNI